MNVAKFTFNPFAENTYVLYDDTKECVVIDPGCYGKEEQQELVKFIEQKGLIPIKVLNTHCHIDHILGNKFVTDTYGIGLEMHEGELKTLEYNQAYVSMYGFKLDPSPTPSKFLKEGDTVNFGTTTLEVLYTPGHSIAHISFYNPQEGILLSGDVLFREGIGRYDLPGGDFNTLMKSIFNKLLVLPDHTVVYSGHGPETTIGYEKAHNPHVRAAMSGK